MLAVRTPGAPQATRTLTRPAIPPSPLRDRVGYSDHVRFRGYFPVHFIPAYNLPVYASQWPLPDTTQDLVRGCSLGFTAAAISGDRLQRTCTAQLPHHRAYGSWRSCSKSCSHSRIITQSRHYLWRIHPTCPVQLLIGRATTNLASGIHHDAYDCDNHNKAAEDAAKLEAGLLPSKLNAGYVLRWDFCFGVSRGLLGGESCGRMSIGLGRQAGVPSKMTAQFELGSAARTCKPKRRQERAVGRSSNG